ncbi:MAG: hypothetical protein ACI35Q_11315 [Marinilabiliaceae bacterium]
MKCPIWLCVGLAAVACGCQKEFKHPDTSGNEVSLSVIPFYKDLMESGETDVKKLSEGLSSKYGEFFDSFCRYELRIGQPGSPMADSLLSLFLSQPENTEVLAACDSVFDKIDIEDEASDAFSCFATLFPEQPVPRQILCHFSFFNSRILVDSAYVSFGIENYLGSKCRFYDWLAVPVYARQNRDSKWVVTDLIKAWILSTMPDESGREDVLTALIYQAKVLYAIHCCMPKIDDCRLFAMSDGQLEWCRSNEANMWSLLAERKLLYSTEMLDKSKLVNEAPFTYFFGNNSPGRSAVYCAYNIVRGYVKRHPDVTPAKLMAIQDAQSILQGSGYSPK